jgi:hypothetical protein
MFKVLAQFSIAHFHFLTRQSRSQSPHPSTTRRIDAAADMHVSFSGRGGRPGAVRSGSPLYRRELVLIAKRAKRGDHETHRKSEDPMIE